MRSLGWTEGLGAAYLQSNVGVNLIQLIYKLVDLLNDLLLARPHRCPLFPSASFPLGVAISLWGKRYAGPCPWKLMLLLLLRLLLLLLLLCSLLPLLVLVLEHLHMKLQTRSQREEL